MTAGANPLAVYGSDPRTARAVESLVRRPNGGDLVLFGRIDGREIVSFDDQVGAHGSAGGDQSFRLSLRRPPSTSAAPFSMTHETSTRHPRALRGAALQGRTGALR